MVVRPGIDCPMKKRWLSSAAALTLFAVFLLRSGPAREGAARGLVLWADILVPSLLPFFAAAGLLSRLGLPEALGRRLPGRRFSGPGAGLFLLGLSGGYPLGAASVAQAVRAGRLSRADGDRLLFFCDNSGPAFAVGALGVGVFGSAGWGLFLWGIHALAALALALLTPGKKDDEGRENVSPSALPFPRALTESVSGAVSALLNIGGYVVFFSALLGVGEAPGFPGLISDILSRRFGWEAAALRALFAGCLELSSGVGAMAGMAVTPGHLALAEFLLSWGGLCVHLQAASVTADAGLDLSRRLRGKLLHGLISAAAAYAASRVML